MEPLAVERVMARERRYGLIDYLRRLARGADDAAPTDRQLLERFVHERNEEAFAQLMQRHGPLVWGVCRRILDRDADAEDAFQAVFLVLARRAASVRWQGDIGNWHYGVAQRIAHQARQRRRREESHMRPPCEVVAPPAEESAWQELRPILDDEIARLPEKYRAVVVLCYLQGKTYREAAQLLSCPEGTVSGRLARAREMLRVRLTRRGLAPSLALLTVLPTQSAEAASPALIRAVLHAAPRFALRQALPEGLISQPVLTLAHEVMRSMMRTKGTILALILLTAVASGTLAVMSSRRQQPDAKPALAEAPAAAKADPLPRPPLKKEWVGRWQSNPFADTVAIEVLYSEKKYEINDARKVAALMEQLTIYSFHNGMVRDFPMFAHLAFYKKDGRGIGVWLGEGPVFSGLGGEMSFDPAFLVALGREFCDEKGKALDLLHRPNEAPANEDLTPVKALTLASLANGFDSFHATYFRGSRLRTAHITDRKMLDQLAAALRVVKQERDKAPKEDPPQQVTFVPKGETEGDAIHGGAILDREHIVLSDFGCLTVKPSFVETLNKQLSQLEGRSVDVLGKNEPPPEELRREQELLEALRSARRFRIRGGNGDIVVDRPEEVKKLAESLKWVETPARGLPLERARTYSLEVTTAKDVCLRLTHLDTGLQNKKVSVNPGDSKLCDVSGYGPMWLDDSFFEEIHGYAGHREAEEEQRRKKETFRLVCEDLPGFMKQVHNIVAFYRQDNGTVLQCLTSDPSRPVVELLQRCRVEKLAWTKEQWDNEIKKLEKRGAGAIVMTPGIGFELALQIAGEKELLVRGFGRLHLPSSIDGPLRHAIESDPKKARKIQVLPR
jgi:RNA polymerase sigma factor (sigma-70 family)